MSGAPAPHGLIGDIGATNARFALVDARGIAGVRVYACDDYPDIETAIAAYLAEEPGGAPACAALAVASPVEGDRIVLTNHPWSFSQRALAERFRFAGLDVINDFTANALALPHLGAGDRRAVGGGAARAGAAIGIIGPGSGLGVGGLVPSPSGWVPLASEGGHVTMAAADERESAVLGRMRQRFDHVSAERVLSGPGLVNLYNTLAELDGVRAAPLAPAQIADPGFGAEDRHAAEAVAMFCAMLGTVAGNLALTLGALGGVYIAGGIVPKLGPVFDGSSFRARFEAKGRFSPYLARIPTFVITHAVPAFLGLAELVRRRQREAASD